MPCEVAARDTKVGPAGRAGAVVEVLFEDAALAPHYDFDVPTRDSASPWKYDSSFASSDYYRAAVLKAPKGDGIETSVFALDVFVDGTVRQGSGAKYIPIMFLVANLPPKLKHRSENIFIAGFMQIVDTNKLKSDPRLADMTQAARKRWFQRERASVGLQGRRIVQDAFAVARDGLLLRDVLQAHTSRSALRLVVPVIGALEVDHPEHMELVDCKWCGYCDVGGRGKAGLSDFAAAVTERSTTQAIALIEPYKRGVEAVEAAEDDEDKRQAALVALEPLEEALHAVGMHVPYDNVLLQDRYIDGFVNVSISPMHVHLADATLEPLLCSHWNFAPTAARVPAGSQDSIPGRG